MLKFLELQDDWNKSSGYKKKPKYHGYRHDPTPSARKPIELINTFRNGESCKINIENPEPFLCINKNTLRKKSKELSNLLNLKIEIK